MPVLIKDPLLEQKLDREGRARRHKSRTRTTRDLLMERLAEIETGRFIEPVRIEQPTGDSSRNGG